MLYECYVFFQGGLDTGARVFGNLRSVLSSAVSRVRNIFGSRAAAPVDEERTPSDGSSMTSFECQQARDAVRAELEAGYQLVNEHLASVRQELAEMDEESERAAQETDLLVHGEAEDGGSPDPGLHHSATVEDLSIYATPAGLETIPEEADEVNNNLDRNPDLEVNDAGEGEGYTGVADEPELGRVRVQFASTPLTRTVSIRHGDRPRIRMTPHHNVCRVLELGNEEGGEGDALNAPDGADQDLDHEDIGGQKEEIPPASGQQEMNKPDGYI